MYGVTSNAYGALPMAQSREVELSKPYKVLVSSGVCFSTLYNVFFFWTIVSLLAHGTLLFISFVVPPSITEDSFLQRGRSGDWTILLLWVGCLIRFISNLAVLYSVNPTVSFTSNALESRIQHAVERAYAFNSFSIVYSVLGVIGALFVNLALFFWNDPYDNPFASPPAGSETRAERVILILVYIYVLVELMQLVWSCKVIDALRNAHSTLMIDSRSFRVCIDDTKSQITLVHADDTLNTIFTNRISTSTFNNQTTYMNNNNNNSLLYNVPPLNTKPPPKSMLRIQF